MSGQEHKHKGICLQVLGGLLDEAKLLLDIGLKPSDSMASRAIGYRQTMAWLLSIQEQGTVSDADIKQLVYNIQAPSRNLLKSQFTFHRDLKMFHWVDAQPGIDSVVNHIVNELDLPQHQGNLSGSLPPRCPSYPCRS